MVRVDYSASKNSIASRVRALVSTGTPEPEEPGGLLPSTSLLVYDVIIRLPILSKIIRTLTLK